MINLRECREIANKILQECDNDVATALKKIEKMDVLGYKMRNYIKIYIKNYRV